MKDKGRIGHGPEESRLGPNRRGWTGLVVSIVNDILVNKEIKKLDVLEGPSGART